MTSSRLLDFFVLEATDYIDRLDVLLSSVHGDERADAASITAQARLLRGSATMARQSPIADLASAIERIGRAVRDDIVTWNPELHAALVAAVDDLKILVRAVRSWGAGDDRRTESRISELVSLYPQATKSHPTPPSTIRNASFIASESAQLATALDNLVAHPSSPEPLAVAVHRLSSLRGVAAINDTPPLAQVLSALDDILRPLHLREALPETQHLGILITAVQLLRRFSQEIAIGGALDVTNATVQEFMAAVGGLVQEASGQDNVVPISRLNFEDGQPQLVSTSRQPGPGAAQRFRLEIAGPCELLRHQVSLTRSATSEMERANSVAEMRASLRVVRAAADSFGDEQIVSFIDSIEPSAIPQTLTLIDEMARALVSENSDKNALHVRLQELLKSRGDAPALPRTSGGFPRATPAHAAPYMRVGPVPAPEPVPAFVAPPLPQRPPTPAYVSPPVSAPAAPRYEPVTSAPAAPRYEPVTSAPPAPIHQPGASAPPEPMYPPMVSPPPASFESPPPAPRRTPMSGAGLSEMLSAGLTGLSSLEDEPLSKPADIHEELVVPIAELLYRGREAISRAQEIRDGIRARSGTPHREELDELFELLDLAVTE